MRSVKRVRVRVDAYMEDGELCTYDLALGEGRALPEGTDTLGDCVRDLSIRDVACIAAAAVEEQVGSSYSFGYTRDLRCEAESNCDNCDPMAGDPTPPAGTPLHAALPKADRDPVNDE